MCKKSQLRDNMMNLLLSIFLTFTKIWLKFYVTETSLKSQQAGQMLFMLKVNFMSLEHSPEGFWVLLWWGYWSSSNPVKTGLSGSGCCSHLLFCFTPRCAMEPDRPGPSTWFITPFWWTTKIKPTELSNKPSLQFISLGVSKNIRTEIQRQSDQGPLQKKYQGTLLRMIRTQRLLRFRWSKNDHPLSESGRKLTGVCDLQKASAT